MSSCPADTLSRVRIQSRAFVVQPALWRPPGGRCRLGRTARIDWLARICALALSQTPHGPTSITGLAGTSTFRNS